MYYLAEHRSMREPVVVSVNNTSMAARLGEHYEIPTHETAVGFKFIGPKMIETGAMLGAEESGGFGFGMHLPERDGVYADLMLLDLFLHERAAGRWPVSRAIELFHEMAGPSWYLRVDVHVERAAYPETKRHLLVGLAEEPPRELAGEPVVRTLRSRPATASSSGWPTGRGCSSVHRARSRSCACMSRRRPRRSGTPSWEPAKGWCVAHDDRRGANRAESRSRGAKS